MNKTYSNTSIEAVLVRESPSPFPRREVGLFLATTNSQCQNSFGRNECPAPKPRVSITEDQVPRCNSARRSTSQISVTQTGCVVSRTSNSNSRTRQNFSDATTQTEWCSVVVGYLNYGYHKVCDLLVSFLWEQRMPHFLFLFLFSWRPDVTKTVDIRSTCPRYKYCVFMHLIAINKRNYNLSLFEFVDSVCVTVIVHLVHSRFM